MSSGESNKFNQPNSLPAVTVSSLRTLGNQVQVLDDVLKERDPEYWFEKALKCKNEKNWDGIYFFTSKSITINSSYVKSYLLRALYFCHKNEAEQFLNDIIAYYTSNYIENYLNNYHQVISSSEWNEMLLYSRGIFYGKVHSALELDYGIKYFASLILEMVCFELGTSTINFDEPCYGSIPQELINKTYIGWLYLLTGKFSFHFHSDDFNHYREVYFSEAIVNSPNFIEAYFERYRLFVPSDDLISPYVSDIQYVCNSLEIGKHITLQLRLLEDNILSDVKLEIIRNLISNYNLSLNQRVDVARIRIKVINRSKSPIFRELEDDCSLLDRENVQLTAVGLIIVASTYHKQFNSYQKAIEYYTRALKLNTNYKRAYEERAIAYDKIGLYEEANQDRLRANQITQI